MGGISGWRLMVCQRIFWAWHVGSWHHFWGVSCCSTDCSIQLWGDLAWWVSSVKQISIEFVQPKTNIISIGAQSAVKTPIVVFFLSVIKASALNLFFVNFNFLSMKWNLLLWIWLSKIIFFDLELIFLLIEFRSCNISFCLSGEPDPQFKLLYVPFDFPTNLLKKPCFRFLNRDNFLDLISLKSQFKFIIFLSYKHNLK